jgi:predicted ArsR family transcriptional regulator
VADLAARLGLHTNTVREHLDALVGRGLADRVVRQAVGRGRPAGWYAPAASRPEPDQRVRDYSGLVTALAGQIARVSTNPRAEAVAAGEDWGRRLAADLPAGSEARARRRVVGLLAELGFAAEAAARVGSVRLLRCPLLDAARAHSDVVCPVHLGIVRGALAALGGNPQRATVLPFSEPGSCRVELNTQIPLVER